MRYAFIEQHRGSYPVQALCAALQVSDSGFATWQRGEGPKKWLSDRALLKLIREIHQETKAAYGSPRIYLELKGRGFPVSPLRVERLMREHGLRGRHKRRLRRLAGCRSVGGGVGVLVSQRSVYEGWHCRSQGSFAGARGGDFGRRQGSIGLPGG